jgi:hypothetical protein
MAETLKLPASTRFPRSAERGNIQGRWHSTFPSLTTFLVSCRMEISEARTMIR